MNLFPKAVAPYAKAWIAFLGFILTTVGVAWSAAPEWLPIAASVLTAVGVYLTPNTEAVHDELPGYMGGV